MAQKKIVTRRYYNKRTRSYVTKTYVYEAGRYDQPSRKSLTLISKRGTIYKKNWEKLREIIKKESEDEAIRRGMLADLDNLLDNYQDLSPAERRPQGNALTINGYLGTGIQNKAERWITNMGYTPQQLAEEMGVDTAELLNEDNWDREIFELRGRRWKFTHGYTGNAYKEIE